MIKALNFQSPETTRTIPDIEHVNPDTLNALVDFSMRAFTPFLMWCELCEQYYVTLSNSYSCMVIVIPCIMVMYAYKYRCHIFFSQL